MFLLYSLSLLNKLFEDAGLVFNGADILSSSEIGPIFEKTERLIHGLFISRVKLVCILSERNKHVMFDLFP